MRPFALAKGFSYNYLGKRNFELVSEEAIPTGRSEIRFVSTKLELGAARGELFVNGKMVASELIARTVPGGFSVSETFDVGRDTGTPIGDMYELPFAFTGKIEDLTVTLN